MHARFRCTRPKAQSNQHNTHNPPQRDTQRQPDEYEKLGSYALIGLPDNEYPTR